MTWRALSISPWSKGALLTIYGANSGGTFDNLMGVNDTQSPQIVNVTVGSALCTTPKVGRCRLTPC